MNDPTESNHSPHDDVLSDVLSQAKWPDEDTDRIERLRRHWEVVSGRPGAPRVSGDPQREPRERVRRLSAGQSIALLVAASVLTAIGLRTEFNPSNHHVVDNAGLNASTTPSLSASDDNDTHQLKRTDENAITHPSDTFELDSHRIRSPNMLERIVFHQHLKQRRNPARLNQILETAVRELAADPKLEASDVARRLLPDSEYHEQRIHDALPVADLHLRVAAVRLLEFVATQRSVPVLVPWVEHPETHGAATRALVRVGAADVAMRVINAEPNRDLQRSLLTVLLNRNDAAATELFLQFVADTRSRNVALEAIQQANDPPVEILLSYLDTSRSDLRMAAAVAVGSMCQDEITQSLINLALAERGRPEPLIALLTCDGDAAQGFLRSAGRRVEFAAAITGAKSRLRAAYPSVMLK